MFFHQNENSINPYNYNKREGKNYFFPPHFHKDFELAYVKEGSCTVTVDVNSQEIKENEFSLILSTTFWFSCNWLPFTDEETESERLNYLHKVILEMGGFRHR